jgi:hypothetical protein
MLAFWKRFEEEGKELFNYLINNFEELFNKDGTIKHFTIRNIGCDEPYNEEISEKYGTDIEKDLIPWIKNEKENKTLFDNSLWKPFRDTYTLSDMYFGYRKLFKYKHYYFQLAIEHSCHIIEFDFCKYCEGYNTPYTFSFTLVLYGWKEDTKEKLQPYEVTIPLNNFIPEKDWIRQ